MKKILGLGLISTTLGCMEQWDRRKRRAPDEHTSHALVTNAMMPFAYCLQAPDRTVMENVVLAGPDGEIGDSYDPYCHQECQPINLSGDYDVDACILCYKNETRLNEIREKYIDAGGRHRSSPSISLIMHCLDTYLPTLLTSEEPYLVQLETNDTAVSGYISVPDEIRLSYGGDGERKRRSENGESNRGSDFWEIQLKPKNSECVFSSFTFESASVLESTETSINLAYDIEASDPNITFSINFNEDCVINGNATDLFFDKTRPAPVMPRFYSVDRTDIHYQIEFGWDPIGYMYVYGEDLDQLTVPQVGVTLPCSFQVESMRDPSYRSGQTVIPTDENSMLVFYDQAERSSVPEMKKTPISITKTSETCQMSTVDTYFRSSFAPRFPEIQSASESSDDFSKTDYTRCIPAPEEAPKCKMITAETFVTSVPDKKMQNGNYVNVLLNQANKRIKNYNATEIECPHHQACEITMIFTHLEASTNCQNKKNCYEGSVSSKCVSLPETKACLDFVDEEEKNQHRHTLQWHKHTQNFYYSWENKRQVLRASVISNAKRLKIEGKRKVSNLIKDSDKGSGG